MKTYFHICSIRNEKSINKLFVSDRWRRSLLSDIQSPFKFYNLEQDNEEKKDQENIVENEAKELVESELSIDSASLNEALSEKNQVKRSKVLLKLTHALLKRY